MKNEVGGVKLEVGSKNSDLQLPTSNFQLLCWLVLAELAITIVVFYAFTRYFA